jgi:hypothetical protein
MEEVRINYKNHTIVVGNYLGHLSNKFYEIYNPSGKIIVNTLWNDDKMWETYERAILFSKKTN